LNIECYPHQKSADVKKYMIVLKERFTMEPILVALDLDKRMEVNVSDYVTGGVLSMKCVDGK